MELECKLHHNKNYWNVNYFNDTLTRKIFHNIQLYNLREFGIVFDYYVGQEGESYIKVYKDQIVDKLTFGEMQSFYCKCLGLSTESNRSYSSLISAPMEN